VVLVVLTVVAFLVARSVLGGRDPGPVGPPPGPAAIEAAMARSGYRPVMPAPGWAGAAILVDAVFAYCPAGAPCNGESGDADHPTVGLSGDNLTAVYLGGSLSARLCVSYQLLAPPVTGPGWLEYVRAVATGAQEAGLGSYGRPSARPSDGWRCVSRLTARSPS
jgi:hypothetical protein